LERFAETDRAQIVEAFSKPEIWKQPIVQKYVVSRLARRYASLPSPENQQALAALAKSAPTPAERALVRQGLAEAFEGQGIGKLTPALEDALFNTEGSAKADPAQLSLDLKRGETGALPAALVFIVREEPSLEQNRIQIIEALSESRMKEAMPVLLELLARSPNMHVRQAAVSALGRFDEPRLSAEILRIWATLDAPLRRRALAVLASRASWTREMFASVGRSGVISKADIPDDIVDRARLLGDAEINQLADHYFGQPKHSSSVEKQRRIDELSQLLKAGPLGKAEEGHALFQARCGLCHKLFGEGAEIGPDLTAYERTNVVALLLAMIDPSVAIREGYAATQLTTKDGRILLGFVQDRDANRIAMRESTGQRTVIALNEVQEERVMKTSLMPEGLLDDLSEEQWRDLFAYLTATR
jgi:putative heme-binding domain-containing protein